MGSAPLRSDGHSTDSYLISGEAGTSPTHLQITLPSDVHHQTRQKLGLLLSARGTEAKCAIRPHTRVHLRQGCFGRSSSIRNRRHPQRSRHLGNCLERSRAAEKARPSAPRLGPVPVPERGVQALTKGDQIKFAAETLLDLNSKLHLPECLLVRRRSEKRSSGDPRRQRRCAWTARAVGR